MTDEATFQELQQALEGLQHATRREKSRRAVSLAGPSYPTQAQWNKLGGLIGSWRKSDVEAYARFANVYHHGPLTRLNLIHAIELAMNGRNVYGTSEEILSVSEDPETVLEPNTGDFQRRMIARRKGMKKADAGNARHMAPTMRELDQERGERLKALAARIDQARADRLKRP